MRQLQLALNVFDAYQRAKKPLGFIYKVFFRRKRIKKQDISKRPNKIENGEHSIRGLKKINFKNFKKIDIIRYFKSFKEFIKLGFTLKNIIFNLRIRAFIRSRR